MKKILLLSILCLSCLFNAQAQDDNIRVMAYNILNYPSAGVGTRTADFATIVNYVGADVIMLQEVSNDAGAVDLLNELNNTSTISYAKAIYFPQGPGQANMLFYNTAKLGFISQVEINSCPRDHSYYHFFIQDPNLECHEDTIFLDFVSAHYKASQETNNNTSSCAGATNGDVRVANATDLMNYINTLPANHNIVVGGDFNMYGSTEGGYALMTSGTNAQALNDVLGGWTRNIAGDIAKYTQSTRSGTYPGGYGGSTGGLDDRFDAIYFNGNIIGGTEQIQYAAGSYDAVGNDSNHFNLALIDPAGNSGGNLNADVPDNIAQALFEMSDHLPVISDLEVYYIPAVDPGTCVDDGDCSNGVETWNALTCLCDQLNIPDPSTCVDDGNCGNGEETWNTTTCTCEQLNIPDPSTCVDDGNCANGEETWNTTTCTCEQLNIPDSSTCVDDGNCANGEETWNTTTCTCEQLNVPDPSTCVDDGICGNGLETWNTTTCTCEQLNIPDPSTCVDDGDCSNGEETWNTTTCTCEQLNIPDPSTCVDDGNCANGEETWNAATCTCEQLNIPDPSTCVDDGNCANGEETWNTATCTCEQLNIPDSSTCVDDGDCANGEETWNTLTCTCEQLNIPDPSTCVDDGNCANGEEVWNATNCVCEIINVPDPSTCVDDGNCANGAETWNTTTCTCDILPATTLGCTDPNFCEYDPAATCDDGSCQTSNTDPGICDDGDCTNGIETWDPVNCNCIANAPPEFLGCTDPSFCEYDPNADCDDGSCQTPNTDPGTCNTNCTLGDIETWNSETCACETVSTPVLGCTDPNFCEYNPAADCDDGSCQNSNADPGTCDDGDCTNGLETWDALDCTCISNPPTGVSGCTDPNFCEYNPAADCDDGSCQTSNADPGTCNTDCTLGGIEAWNSETCACETVSTPVLGCTDPNFCEYNPNADCDDGSCQTSNADPGTCNTDCTLGDIEAWNNETCTCETVSTPVLGCTDPNFCEYNPAADCDDGSCQTSTADSGTCNTDCTLGDIEAWNSETCACETVSTPVLGCTDPNFCEYNPAANCDDGSCQTSTADPGTCNTDICVGDTEVWNTSTCTCSTLDVQVLGCTDPSAGNFNPFANCDDGSCTFEVPGCVDANADNFDPAATTDDGSCVYSGCTDPNAPNYNPLATTDDGTCLPANPTGCNLTMEIEQDQGNLGGISVFYYNTTEVQVIGGTSPYTYNWDAVGYVRNAVVGNGAIRVIHSDNATWCVTITDATNCSLIVCEDIFNGGTPTTSSIDIVSSDITPATNFQATGGINISVGGGTLPYSYQWSTGSTSQDIYGLSSGWYSVTACDADNLCTEGWFWVPNRRAGGRGKIEQATLTIFPNPTFEDAQIQFAIPQSEVVHIQLFSLAGNHLQDVFKGTITAQDIHTTKLETASLQAGVYLLQMTTASGFTTYEKVVVAK